MFIYLLPITLSLQSVGESKQNKWNNEFYFIFGSNSSKCLLWKCKLILREFNKKRIELDSHVIRFTKKKYSPATEYNIKEKEYPK